MNGLDRATHKDAYVSVDFIPRALDMVNRKNPAKSKQTVWNTQNVFNLKNAKKELNLRWQKRNTRIKTQNISNNSLDKDKGVPKRYSSE